MPVDDRELTPTVARRALDEFEAALDERWSYRHANGADFGGAVAALRDKIDGGLSTDAFGIELQRIVALGIDGHARVSGYTLPGGRSLPFLVEPAGERVVAFDAARTGFLADGFPYLTAIDGREIADWCRAAAQLVPKGSPQYRRHRSLGLLRNLAFVRAQLALPQTDTLEVTLAAGDGGARTTLQLRTATSPPSYGAWPRGGSRLLAGGVGYLRLAFMDKASSVREILRWMPAFRHTAGLVVDVRDNDGGDRDALRRLYAYLAAPGDAPRVRNAAVYRLHAAHREDHLAGAHFMYRADAAAWTPDERRAVAAFAGTFRPEWAPPAGQFSAWHYLVLSRRDGPDVYHYARPVVVLMNGKCFSATDVFLAGLQGLPHVTLLGTPSSGGSAGTREVGLGATPLRVRFGTIASFQADGRLFDGHGVRPDVPVAPTPESHIGGADNVLAAAVERVRRR
jgi:hypothetical protein